MLSTEKLAMELPRAVLASTENLPPMSPNGQSPKTPGKENADPSSPGAASTACSPSDLRMVQEGLTDARRPLVEDVESQQPAQKMPTWEAFGATFGIFAGYACLFALQHEVKKQYGIPDDASDESRNFSAYVSLLYIFNLIFRFAHNMVSSWVSPRGRVLLCFCFMIASLTILGGVVCTMGSRWIGWVPIAYALGGMCIGTFEANMLSLLTPYGDMSKRWAVTSIPFGITLITIGAFLVMEAGVPVEGIYFGVIALLFCGMALVALRIPGKAERVNGAMMQDFKAWREWLPKMITLPPAMTLDMFCVSTFCPALILFIYDKPEMTVFGTTVSTRLFTSAYDLATFIGGALGRWCSYSTYRLVHPVCFNLLSIIGVLMIIPKIPEIAPIAGFLILFGDGCIYGYTCRTIDQRVPRRYTLVATSFWLFIGDIGSVTGANVLFYLRNAIGS